MAKAVKRPAESWVYVLKSDRSLEEREQSRFLLSPMSFAQRAAVNDDMLRADGMRLHRSAGEIALDHIVSIDNFPAGNPKPWPKDRSDREKYLELIDDEQITEIGNEVYERSTLGEDRYVLKNSPSLEGTSPSGASPTTIPSSTAAPLATAIPS